MFVLSIADTMPPDYSVFSLSMADKMPTENDAAKGLTEKTVGNSNNKDKIIQ